MEAKRIIFYVYILINNRKNVMYVGCTEDLKKRIYFHRNRLISGFTKKYNVDQLVYYERFTNKEQALKREYQIKRYTRKKKNDLVTKSNPDFLDIYHKVSR